MVRLTGAGLLLYFTSDIIGRSYSSDLMEYPATQGNVVWLGQQGARYAFALGVYLLARPIGEVTQLLVNAFGPLKARQQARDKPSQSRSGQQVKGRENTRNSISDNRGYGNLDSGQA